MRRPRRFFKIQIGLLILLWAAVFVLVFGDKKPITTIRHAKESALKVDLKAMRNAIDDYAIDKLRPPESLQNLVDEGYLPLIPTNPFAQKPDWLPHYTNFELNGGKSAVGIDDVHASAPYSDW